jgi:ApaG protein
MKNPNRYACEVKVEVSFLAEHSNVEENTYSFAYHVTITNTGDIAAQLISRHWIITEADGEQHEVRGLGVVGEQPVIAPHANFSYTSSTMIHMPTGSMHGTYQMIAEDGTTFDATIPLFALIMPRVLH